MSDATTGSGPVRRWAIGAAVVVALAWSSPAPVHATETTPAPDVDSGTVLAAKTYPGIQLVQTAYSADVTVRVPTLDQAAIDTLSQRLLVQVSNGTLGADLGAITEAIVQELESAPDQYIVATAQSVTESASLSGVGTGWVITPDGYVVTAAHVVSSDTEELNTQFAGVALQSLADEFVKGLTASNADLTPGQVDRLTDVILDWFARNLTVDGLQVDVSVNLAVGVAGQGKRQEPVAAEVVDVGVPYPGNDIALLKIDGDDLPTMPLGADDDVAPGSTLHVVGYPAASTFDPAFSEDSQVQPTVTEGPLTAIKTTAAGMPVFQTQAPASPGNSGGPVLSEAAEVVGVLVAAAVGDDGVALEGQEFVIPVSVVEEMLDDNDVTPEQGETTRAYSTALDAFFAQRYREALPLFQQAEELYPDHPYVADYIDKTNAAIAAGEDRTPSAGDDEDRDWLLPALIAAGALALLLLITLLVVLARGSARRRRAGAVPTPPVPAGAGPVGWPAQQPPYPPPAAPATYAPPAHPPTPPAAQPTASPPPGPPPPYDAGPR